MSGSQTEDTTEGWVREQASKRAPTKTKSADYDRGRYGIEGSSNRKHVTKDWGKTRQRQKKDFKLTL